MFDGALVVGTGAVGAVGDKVVGCKVGTEVVGRRENGAAVGRKEVGVLVGEFDAAADAGP